MFLLRRKIPITNLLNGFHDIHCHILPGVDDGCRTAEQSTEILNRLETLGVRGLWFTPHIMAGTYPNNRYEYLLQEFDSHKFQTTIDIRLGAEYMVDENTLSHFESQHLSHGESVLVEFSNAGRPRGASELIFDISLKGYNVILAHPERYTYLYDRGTVGLDKLENTGCNLQLNLLSLSKRYGPNVRKTAMQLLESDRYTYVGSDIHNINHLNALCEMEVSRKEATQIEKLMDNNSKLYL